MKTNFIISLLIMGTAFLKGQTDLDQNEKKCQDRVNQTIIFDFDKGHFEKAMIKPCSKTPTFLKIKNINRLVNKIIIEPKDIAIKDPFLYEEKLPEKEDTLKIKKVKSIPIEKIKIVTSDNSNKDLAYLNKIKELKKRLDEKKAQVEKQNTSLYEKLNLTIKNLSAEAPKFKTAKDSLDYIKKDSIKNNLLNTSILVIQNKIKDDNNEIIKIEKELEKYSKENTNYHDNVNQINEIYSTLLQDVTNLNKINYSYSNYLDKIKDTNLNLEKYLEMKQNSLNENGIENISILKKGQIGVYNSYINTYESDYNIFFKKYNDFFNSEILKNIIDSNDNGKIIAEKIEQDYKKMKDDVVALNDKIIALDLRKKLNQVEVLDRIMSTPSTYEYVSIPIQGIEDYLDFDIKITNKYADENSNTIENEKEFKYFEYLKGGIRWDFSVGVVFDFFIKNQKFDFETVDTLSKKILVNNKDSYTPNLAGMFHTSFRSSSTASFGLSLGASLNVTEFSLNSLFFGPSLLLGKKEKFIITMGPSFKRVKQLKENYNFNDIIDNNLTETDITRDSFKIGFFVGFTYNLTKKQKSNFKIVNE